MSRTAKALFCFDIGLSKMLSIVPKFVFSSFMFSINLKTKDLLGIFALEFWI